METERNFIFDPSLVLYLPLYKLDGASFVSKDAYGHLCTVTGALWKPYGRNFDGMDDKIALGSILNSLTSITLIAWFNSSDVTASQAIIAKWGTNLNWYVGIYGSNFRGVAKSGGGDRGGSGNITLVNNTWYCGAFVCASEDQRLYLNAQSDMTPTTIAGDVDSSTQNVFIGARGNDGTAWLCKNLIGEVLVFNRALSSAEVLRHYLATKWKYK
jgi:hypothetical protein